MRSPNPTATHRRWYIATVGPAGIRNTWPVRNRMPRVPILLDTGTCPKCSRSRLYFLWFERNSPAPDHKDDPASLFGTIPGFLDLCERHGLHGNPKSPCRSHFEKCWNGIENPLE